MSESYQIITSEDLKNLGISKYVQDIVLEGVNLERMQIQDLLQMLDNLIKTLSQVMIQQQQQNKSYTYSYSFKNIRKNTFKQFILLGGLLVFRIRQFLLQETIYYSLGATDEKGQLFQRKMSQDELWSQVIKNNSALRGSLSQKAIMLSKSLEKFNNNNFESVGNLNLWPQILNLAFGGPAIKEVHDPENGKFYQKDSNDLNVYVRYSEGRKKAKRNYYYKKNNQYLFYNQGWLYEWYLTYINESENHELMLLQSIQKNSIAPIIYGMDKVAGITAGDFMDIQGHQVQAKFHNQKIISFTNIMDVLYSIQKELKQLIKNPNEISQVSERFVNIFIDDSKAISHLNSNYTDIINNQLLSILKFD